MLCSDCQAWEYEQTCMNLGNTSLPAQKSVTTMAWNVVVCYADAKLFIHLLSYVKGAMYLPSEGVCLYVCVCVGLCLYRCLCSTVAQVIIISYKYLRWASAVSVVTAVALVSSIHSIARQSTQMTSLAAALPSEWTGRRKRMRRNTLQNWTKLSRWIAGQRRLFLHWTLYRSAIQLLATRWIEAVQTFSGTRSHCPTLPSRNVELRKLLRTRRGGKIGEVRLEFRQLMDLLVAIICSELHGCQWLRL